MWTVILELKTGVKRIRERERERERVRKNVLAARAQVKGEKIDPCTHRQTQTFTVWAFHSLSLSHTHRHNTQTWKTIKKYLVASWLREKKKKLQKKRKIKKDISRQIGNYRIEESEDNNKQIDKVRMWIRLNTRGGALHSSTTNGCPFPRIWCDSDCLGFLLLACSQRMHPDASILHS